MSSVQTLNKQQICKLWGVKTSYINAKLKEVTSIVQSDLNESELLQMLNKHGMDVQSVIIDILESNQSDHNENHNHNTSNPMEIDDALASDQVLINDENSATRKSPEQQKRVRSNPPKKAKKHSRSVRNRKRKRKHQEDDIDKAPNNKKRKINPHNSQKEEATSLIVSILNQHKTLNRDKLLSTLNNKMENRRSTWRRCYQHTLGSFDEFIKNNDRINITEEYKRNFIVQLNDPTEDEQDDIDKMELDEIEQNENEMSLSLRLSDSESIEMMNNENLFILPESDLIPTDDELDITTNNIASKNSKKSSSKEERDSEDEESEDTPPITTNSSMKQEEVYLALSMRPHSKTWQKKVFNSFQFKYSISTNKDAPSWFRKDSVKPIKTIEDLYNLQSSRNSYTHWTVEYDNKYISDDESILKSLYDEAFLELSEKPQKPKQNINTIRKKKKERKDYTIQSSIKKTKALHGTDETETKKYHVQIEIKMYRYQKSGDCFVVDIPATVALTTKSKPLIQDIYESLHIMDEYHAKGHQQTSISLLDFACRYNDDGINPFKFGEQCRICYKIPMIKQTEIPCGHRFCAPCISKLIIATICPVCAHKYKASELRTNQEEVKDEEDQEMEDEDEEAVAMKQKKYGLNVVAFPYQIQSIEWMIQRETDEEGLYKYLFRKGQFKNGEVFYYSAVLNRLVLTDTLPVIHGGFLCEEMGLGKTVECLAVIYCNKRKSTYSTSTVLNVAFKETALRRKRVEVEQKEEKKKKKKRKRNLFDSSDDDDDSSVSESSIKLKKKKKKKIYKFVEEMKEYTYYGGKGTLIIGPVSLIGQWEHEVDTRSNGDLSYKRYYGQRSRNIKHYLDYDIIFTTFGVLAKEDGNDRRNHVLHRIQWHRIILDESHYIKNGAARTSININELKANSKWLLSGTPFERPIDLFNQFKFIGIEQEYINAMGLKNNANERRKRRRLFRFGRFGGSEYSKALIKSVKYMMMRHKKGQKFNNKPIVTMPEKEEDIIYVEFDAKQKEYYDKLYATAKETFDSYKATGNIARGYIPILSSLHPARQACSGYIASITAIEEQLSAAQESTHKIRVMVERNRNKSSKELYELARVEAYNKDGQCVICLECPPDEPLQTPCRHIFCGECIRAQLEANGECPICRKQTGVNQLKLPPSDKKEDDNHNIKDGNDDEQKDNDDDEDDIKLDDNQTIKFDAKLKVLVSSLNKLRVDRPCDKSLIFTSFSKSLDWICCELERNNIKYSTLTGSMTMNKRAQNLKRFSNDPSVKVFVLTVRTGAVGLTLTSANHVFMMEPTFNPALHRQAINRVYRLGQEKKVFIHTLIMKDSIEQRIWNINKDKQKGDIDNKTNKNMYGNIKDDKAGALQNTEIEKLFQIDDEQQNDI